ncbi:MAG TPA: hypothetical protein VF655_11065 [Allosphingosinicella sp.]|jgi:hypothetical protein
MKVQSILLLLSGALSGAPLLEFSAADPSLAPAAAEYRALWCADGARIIATMERLSGQPYPGGVVKVLISNNTPMTAFGGGSMTLKASYPTYYRRATLVHEIGHRLAFTVKRNTELDEHRLLYLFLYDSWSDLYRQAYADRMVAIERQIQGRYDYAAAWDWALGLSRAERQARLVKLRGEAAAPARGAATPANLPGC